MVIGIYIINQKSLEPISYHAIKEMNESTNIQKLIRVYIYEYIAIILM